MIIIGGGFSEKNLQRIAEQVGQSYVRFDTLRFSQFIHEVFGKLGGGKKKDTSKVKSRILTPDQVIEAEALRRRVQAILNRPPAIQKPY